MKFLKNIATTGLVAAAIGFSVVAQPQQAQALSLKFDPQGAIIPTDGDLTRSIAVDPNSPFSVNVVLNVLAGEIGVGESWREIAYGLGWDGAELTDAKLVIPGFGDTSIPNPDNVTRTINLASGFAGDVVLGTFKFTTGSAAALKNDGLADLFLTRAVIAGVLPTGFNQPALPPVIDVQNKVPTPALLPGIAAMGMGLLRRKKAQKVAA